MVCKRTEGAIRFRALAGCVVLLLGMLVQGCKTVDRSVRISPVAVAGSNLVIGATGATSSLVGGLRKKGYCGILNTHSKRWSPEEAATIDKKVTTGFLELDSGRKIPWKATACTPRQNWNGKVIWYFHGLCGDGDFTWTDREEATWKVYQAFGEKKPMVIGLSLGDDWLLNDGLNVAIWKVLVGLRDSMNLPRRGNYLLGFSMGGFNALRFYADYDAAIHFERCVVISPSLPGCKPYASPEELNAYYRQPKGIPLLKKDVIKLVREFFPDEQSWEAADPLENVDRFRGKPILVLAGDRDIFGFQVTAEEFARKVGCRFLSFDGKHQIPSDEESVRAIAEFLK